MKWNGKKSANPLLKTTFKSTYQYTHTVRGGESEVLLSCCYQHKLTDRYNLSVVRSSVCKSVSLSFFLSHFLCLTLSFSSLSRWYQLISLQLFGVQFFPIHITATDKNGNGWKIFTIQEITDEHCIFKCLCVHSIEWTSWIN